jgi:uncharacterized coiled-coil DUF342 family protein
MGTTQRKRESISQEQIEQAKRLMKNLPTKQSSALSKQEAVQALKKEIMSLKSRGYDFSEIAEQLANAGIQISAATLKSYLRTPAKKKKDNEVQVQDPLKETP